MIDYVTCQIVTLIHCTCKQINVDMADFIGHKMCKKRGKVGRRARGVGVEWRRDCQTVVGMDIDNGLEENKERHKTF